MGPAFGDDVTAGFSSPGRVELVVAYLWLLMGLSLSGVKGLEKMMGKLGFCSTL